MSICPPLSIFFPNVSKLSSAGRGKRRKTFLPGSVLSNYFFWYLLLTFPYFTLVTPRKLSTPQTPEEEASSGFFLHLSPREHISSNFTFKT